VMSEGRIEQIGTPFEIYNFPATSFVASFVGTLNVLETTVVEASSGRLTVDGQEFRAASPITGSRDGAKQPIAIRPEMLSMGDGGGDNVMRGTVEDVTFLGAVVRIKVRTAADGHVLAIDTFNDPNLAVPQRGGPATMSFPPAAVLVLDAPPAETAEDLIAEQ
ncbi:MAG: TOBE domain-containing protein, partial [Candidatus Limnocylindrales bacterium]